MIPTEEQFAELTSALNRSVDFINERLDYSKDSRSNLHFEHEKLLSEISSKEIPSHMIRKELLKILTEKELAEFIKVDVNLYLEQSHLLQKSIAWIWLHSQQNFIRAKERRLKHWPAEENPGNGLEKHIALRAVQYFESRMKERETFITQGITLEEKGSTLKERVAARLVNSSSLEIYQSALSHSAKRIVLYRKWVAGVMLALSNYHYGETAENAINRKDRVEELISTWESFSEQLEMVQLDAELSEFVNNSMKRIRYDRFLCNLRELHRSGTLHFINRNDETVSERLFIQEIAILNRKLFYKPPISMIADLFYLDGMKSAPTERAIQRIAKSAISNLKERISIMSMRRT